MNQKTLSNLSHDQLATIVSYFLWLKSIRDKKSTQVDTLEPLNELNSCVDKIQELFLE